MSVGVFLLALIICLLLTIVLEEGTALIIGIRKGFDLTVILFTNTLTNPLIVSASMLLQAFTRIPRWSIILVLEIIVFITEALIYKKLLYCEKPSPFIISLILNGVSFFIGTTLASLIFDLIF